MSKHGNDIKQLVIVGLDPTIPFCKKIARSSMGMTLKGQFVIPMLDPIISYNDKIN